MDSTEIVFVSSVVMLLFLTSDTANKAKQAVQKKDAKKSSRSV